MNSSIKMNHFLQRMLKKNEEEKYECESVIMDSTSLKVAFSPERNKFNWMRKLGAYSPTMRDASPSVRSPSRPITPRLSDNRHDYRRRSVPEGLTTKNFSTTDDMTNLEDIIHEFEKGFLSPTKQETMATSKSGRFVKKIVAAFEEKYKARNNEPKIPAEQSPIKPDERQNTTSSSQSAIEELSNISSAFLGTTYTIDSLESRLSQFLDSSISKSSHHSNENPDTFDPSECFFAMDQELTFSTPTKKSPEATTNPRETSIVVQDEKIGKSRTIVRSNSSLRRERQPKIVGAFLKKPIEVEDTSIDWIPITNNKRLPRKKSFKRLLSVLTGRNRFSDKSSKLYCSQMNLREETSRELHDSGYDEKSCSSSSLTSLVSITDLLMNNRDTENNRDAENNRRSATMSTFKKSTSSINRDDDFTDEVIIADDFSDTCSVNSRKLLLEEIPRSECRLSLGPAVKPKFVTKSLDRRDPLPSKRNTDLEDYYGEISTPPASPLPKHPFISARGRSVNGDDFSPDEGMNFHKLNDIELRRDFQPWEFSSSETTYDVPRRYLSKSEPGLYKQPATGSPADRVVYDIPKPTIPQRPKSSVYEDALSLKRRNANFSALPVTSGFYAFPCPQEPHYATVKPRNAKINPSRELLRYVGDLGDRREYEIGNYCTRISGETRYI